MGVADNRPKRLDREPPASTSVPTFARMSSLFLLLAALQLTLLPRASLAVAEKLKLQLNDTTIAAAMHLWFADEDSAAADYGGSIGRWDVSNVTATKDLFTTRREHGAPAGPASNAGNACSAVFDWARPGTRRARMSQPDPVA